MSGNLAYFHCVSTGWLQKVAHIVEDYRCVNKMFCVMMKCNSSSSLVH